MTNGYTNIEVTPGELQELQRLRREHAIPDAVGKPMPFDESKRAWGEEPPANPPSVQRLIDPAAWVQKQIDTLSAVGETNYRQGITRPRKSPIGAGIAAQAKYEARMRDPEVLKRRESGLRATSDDVWASRAERIGAGRLVQGVVERRAKVEQKVQAYHGQLSQHLQRIDAMPDVTDSDRERRMIENLHGLKAMKGRI